MAKLITPRQASRLRRNLRDWWDDIGAPECDAAIKEAVKIGAPEARIGYRSREEYDYAYSRITAIGWSLVKNTRALILTIPIDDI